MSFVVFKHIEPGRKIRSEITTPNCTELVREFVYFLKAISFHPNTIQGALDQIAEEMKAEVVKDE